MSARFYETRACDRCGFELEKTKAYTWADWIEVKHAAQVGDLPAKGDLCPDCSKELVSWWRAKS